jgi:hypothetical protein
VFCSELGKNEQKEVIRMAKRISVKLNVLVDFKIGDNVDIPYLISRLECNCVDVSGQDAKIIDVKILDRKLLIEEDTEE